MIEHGRGTLTWRPHQRRVSHLGLLWLVIILLMASAPGAHAAVTIEGVELHTKALWRRAGNHRVIVAVHGGGFHRGSRADTGRVGLDRYFLSRGYDVLAVDYELSCEIGNVPHVGGTGPCSGPGSAPLAVATVGRWTRWAAARYSDVTVFGGSAGGYLAIASAQPAFVDRVIAVSPAIDPEHDRNEGMGTWPTAWEPAFACIAEACDIHALPAPRVPIRIIHARDDRATSHEASRAYAQQHPTLVTLRSHAGDCHGWCLVWRTRTHRIGL